MLILCRNLRVEAGQSQRGPGSMDEYRNPAGLAHAGKHPGVHDQGRGDPERDHIRHAVVLGPEGALGIGEPRDPTVEPIQHHGDEDGHGGCLELTVHGRGDRVEARKERRCSEEIGQQIDATPFMGRLIVLFHRESECNGLRERCQARPDGRSVGVCPHGLAFRLFRLTDTTKGETRAHPWRVNPRSASVF